LTYEEGTNEGFLKAGLSLACELMLESVGSISLSLYTDAGFSLIKTS
jgi:hypothetical protein